jgi:antitoxin component of MazEF toxin-antitoxin module
MIELTVRKFGKSVGVILPKDVLDRLRVNVGESLFVIEGPDGSYLLMRHGDISAKIDDILDRYRHTLGILAE